MFRSPPRLWSHGPVCSHTPGLDPPSGAAGQISVDRHVVGPVSCFHLHQPVLLFTDHRFYRLSSSITWLKVPHVSDFMENVELAAIYRNIPCSLLVLHYYTFHFMFIFTFSYGNVWPVKTDVKTFHHLFTLVVSFHADKSVNDPETNMNDGEIR